MNNILKYETLEDLIEDSKNDHSLLTQTEKFIIFHAIAKNLEEIHNNNIFYGNVAPHNIKFSISKKTLTCNFTRNFGNHSNDIMFSSLEVLFDQINEQNGQKSDIFSFGMIIYYLMTKNKPYINIYNLDSQKIKDFWDINTKLELPKEVPSFFKYLIYLTMKKNPDERPTISQIIELVDSGLIFPSIIASKKELNYYMKYTNTKEKVSNVTYETLKNLQQKFINTYRNDRLAAVITLFLADYYDDPKAQRDIGKYYYYGIILDKDGDKAFQYFSKSSEKFDSESLFYLGQAYVNGIGCDQNKDKAKIYLEQSSNLGYKEASVFLRKNYITVYNFVDSPKVIILGYVSTGKTTFVKKLKNMYDTSISISTIQSVFTNIPFIDENNNHFEFKIEDTHGMERFASLPPIAYRDASLAIVMFAVDCENSFLVIDQIIKELKKYCNAKILIIGNKIDTNRSVSYNEANFKASSNNAQYIEVSSMHGTNMRFALQLIATTAKQAAIDVANSNIQNLECQTAKAGCCLLL